MCIFHENGSITEGEGGSLHILTWDRAVVVIGQYFTVETTHRSAGVVIGQYLPVETTHRSVAVVIGQFW